MSRRIILLVDFDETLTRAGRDTISVLSSAAYSLRGEVQQEGVLPPWSYFTDKYLSDYNMHSKMYSEVLRNTVIGESGFLRSLKSVERKSVERVEAFGVFKGLVLSGLVRKAGEGMVVGELMRDGWWEAAKKVMEREYGRVVVVSVNWSRSWVRSCLEGSAREEGVRKIEVFANELVVDKEGVTTGRFDRWFGEDGGIWTGWDKLMVMKDIITRSRNSVRGEDPGIVVYVGDSTTDLLCLLEADVGIFFGQKLDSTCERLGVRIEEGLSPGYSGNMTGGGRTLVRVKEWSEIERWIDGI